MDFLCSGEHVDYPVDRLGRRGRVQRTEYQVARFRSRQGQTNSFQVTHLTHQNDVRVFPQRRAQGFGKAQGVR